MKGYLSNDDHRRFIELVCQNPLLYDPTAKNTDLESTKAVWARIAAEMNVPSMCVHDWKCKWKCLRDTFVKKRRDIRYAEKQEQIDKAMHWKFYRNMSFLEPFVTRFYHKAILKSKGEEFQDQHYTIIKNEEYEEEDSGEEDGDEDSTAASSYGKVSAEDTPVTGSRRRTRQAPQQDQSYDATEVSGMSPSANTEDGTDSWDMEGSNSKSFFQSCAYRLDKLPDRVQSYLQFQISQLFFNAENPDVPAIPIMPLPSPSTINNSPSPTST